VQVAFLLFTFVHFRDFSGMHH